MDHVRSRHGSRAGRHDRRSDLVGTEGVRVLARRGGRCMAAMIGAVVGFFTIPVLGVVVGGIGGLWLAELVRLRHPRRAWDTTWAAVQGYGVGTVVQMLAGAAIFGVWLG